jgi:hypothetical protein
MKETKRALRRHHADRLRRAMIRRLKLLHWFDQFHVPLGLRIPEYEAKSNLLHYVSRNWNNPQGCSCPLCGNRRKFEKGIKRLSMAERRQLDTP